MPHRYLKHWSQLIESITNNHWVEKLCLIDVTTVYRFFASDPVYCPILNWMTFIHGAILDRNRFICYLFVYFERFITALKCWSIEMESSINCTISSVRKAKNNPIKENFFLQVSHTQLLLTFSFHIRHRVLTLLYCFYFYLYYIFTMHHSVKSEMNVANIVT